MIGEQSNNIAGFLLPQGWQNIVFSHCRF